jgi:TonB family protein
VRAHLASRCISSLALVSLAAVSAPPGYAQETVILMSTHELACPTAQLPTSKGCLPMPQRTKYVMPEIPGRARSAGVPYGEVTIKCFISADGRVVQPTVIKSFQPGYGFEESALKAVKKWRYRPIVVDSVPVILEQIINIKFNLP